MYENSFDTRPIGIFDSGVGGLTVLKSLLSHFPSESFVYLGDTARLPYGSKSPETIERYSQQIIDYLLKRNVKAVIIACNSASSSYSKTEYQNIPIFNVITPGAQLASETTKNLRVGVVGTRTTVNSHAYLKAIQKLNPLIQVFEQPCPLWVPLAEEGWTQDPITNLVVYRYLTTLLKEEIDTLVLGCTHYPILIDSIHKITGQRIALVESGHALSEILKKEFGLGRLTPNDPMKATLEVLATDTNDHFLKIANTILPSITQVEHVDLK